MIGLQAIAKYASLIYSNGISVGIAVTNSSRNTIASFTINNDNSLVEYREQMNDITDIRMTASGTGCFLFQV